MSLLSRLLTFVSGPDVQFKTENGKFVPYAATLSESSVSFVYNSLSTIITIAKWTHLFWGYKVVKNVIYHSKLYDYSCILFGFSLLYISVYFLRGLCRSGNKEYVDFINIYEKAHKTRDQKDVDELLNYVYDSTWPHKYSVKENASLSSTKSSVPIRPTNYDLLFKPISYFLINTIGVRLAYPGVLGFIQSSTLQPRVETRLKMSKKYGLKRVGIETRDGDFVDAVYADRRGEDNNERSKILFVCCEGNAGYPEIGTIDVPLSQGYSIVGWNHPGFGSSTSLPFKNKEENAIEAVMEFAIHQLKFKMDNIYLLGWSIGGYTVTWAAMNYPKVAGIVLDATFDNIDALSKEVMPSVVYPIVLSTVRQHIDLNNLDQIKRYDGPVCIIRRANDEIISAGPIKNRESNRGNYLLVGMLQHRYPNLFTKSTTSTLMDYLALDDSKQKNILAAKDVVTEKCNEALLQHVSNMPGDDPMFPSALGMNSTDEEREKLLLYLTSKYFKECRGTHCTPLEKSCFQLPWSEKQSTEVIALSD